MSFSLDRVARLGCLVATLFVALTCAAASSASPPGTSAVSSSLFFFAHQDDDLLFANPAIKQRIRAGLPTRVVFLTASGSPDTASWQAREHGVYGAYNTMAGVTLNPPWADTASAWTKVQRTFAGKTAWVATCNAQPHVSVVFLRLPDNGLSSLWSTQFGPPFWVGTVGSLTTADNANQYTKAELIQTLGAIINDFQPGEIGSMDSSFAYGEDHQDHIASALFALEAEHLYTQPHGMRQFRGYNIYGNYFSIPVPEIANLSAAEYAEKTQVMVAYGGGFPANGDYDHWCARHYAVAKMPGGTGPLVTSQGLAVAPQGGSSAPGTPVVLATANDTLVQQWTITADGLVIGIGGLCLTVGANGSTVTLETPNGSARQRWTLFSNGQLRGYNGTCLTIGSDGVSLSAQLCDADRSTNLWTVPDTQRFLQPFGAPRSWSTGTNFSDADVPTATTYSATVALADVNGDGYADACVRRAAGVYVALNNQNGAFSAYQLYSASFSDAAGWQPDQYGSTLQFADVNGDGRADVIGRSSAGVVVGLANAAGSAFDAPTLWTSSFSDAAGFGGSATYYRTLRVADVNGDGYADVLGRGPTGILVALNTKTGGFGSATLWSANFADGAGWQPVQYGTTIEVGDVNGDGLADVCGRSSAGVFCAVSTGTSFTNYHQWSLRTDFSDAGGWGGSAAYYGSLRLADVNGDGFVDLCGRGPNGIVCAMSHGNGTDRTLAMMTREFTDARGWSAVAYGSSISFGDLNADGKADVIGRNATGLIGVLAPGSTTTPVGPSAPPPSTPTITAASPVTAGASGLTAAVTAYAGMTYSWTISGGTITSAGGAAGVTSGSQNSITYTAGAGGTITLTCVEVNSAGQSSSPATVIVTVVAAPITPIITAASPVTASSTGRTASVAFHAGMTYTWTLSGGTITSAGGAVGVTSGGTNTITYTAPSSAGTLTITCTETNIAGTSSAPGSASVTVAAVPVTPVITTASSVTPSSTGNTASVTFHTGMTYTWTISGGTITSAGGTAGVTSGGTNSITYTAPSASGPLTLTCIETNAAGSASAPGTANVTVTSAPVTPVITTVSPVPTSSTGNTASVTARAGMTYTWTISGGTITSAGGTAGVTSGGTNTITYTAPSSPGTLTITCTETNAVGNSSTPGTASVTVASVPATPVITTASSVPANSTGNTASVTVHAGMTYTWTISGGTITSAGGAAGVTSGGTNTITFTAGASGSIVLTCVETNSSGLSSAPGSATVAITTVGGGNGSLFFFAHQDDDLLFANPAIQQRIHAGLPTRVVFLTAAGSPDTASWQAREHGVYGAYNTMAGVTLNPPWADTASAWTKVQRTFAGKTAWVATCNAQPHVSVVFLRLPDNGLSSLWSTQFGPPFWVGTVGSLTTADNANQYTKAELIQTLAAIINDFQPGEIGSMDSSFAYGDDHQDHVASALFTLEAEHLYTRPHGMRQFRGYNVYGNYFTIPVPESANLAAAEYAAKSQVMVAYGGGFPANGDYDHWCARHYAVAKMPGGTGPLVTSQGLAVAPQGGSSAPGTPVVLATANDTLAQQWTITADGLVIGIGGLCLTVGANGSTVTMEMPNGSARQRWTLFSNGQLRGYNGTCLTIGSDGVSLSAQLGDADRSANLWTVSGTQCFVQPFGAPHTWSAGTNFADADVPTAATYSATVALADVNGDGYADACVRRVGGVYVAINNHNGGFGTYQLFSSFFSDSVGWTPEQYGSTLQFADVNNDGRADVIARSSIGVIVALANSNGTAFGSPALWTSSFGDSAGFTSATYYRTMRVADVNGDGYADVLGRGPTGILVALNTQTGGFGTATLWSANFADGAGWQPVQYGTTIQVGDVNGDGLADVCGRSSAGVFCAVSTGTGFTNYHQWSLRTDFSDAAGWGGSAAYYGSLRLADVNGDGVADLCGRGPNGIVCAMSHGNGMDRALAMMTREFTDARGWNGVAYGSSISFGDLNADGKADVIGRSSTGLVGVPAP